MGLRDEARAVRIGAKGIGNMRDGEPEMGLMEVVRLVRMLDGDGSSAEDAATVLSTVEGEGAGAAARAMALFSCRAPLGEGESRVALGIPLDSRPTLCRVVPCRGQPDGFTMVEFDAGTTRRAAFAAFRSRAHDIPLDLMGCPVPEESRARLAEARRRPALAGHLVRSAADHMAAFVDNLLRELPDVHETAAGRFSWSAAFPAGKARQALAWLSEPGPGAFAATVSAFLPQEFQR